MQMGFVAAPVDKLFFPVSILLNNTQYVKRIFLSDFFKRIELEELSVARVVDLLQKRSEWAGNREMLDRLDDIRPLLKIE